ncbi:major facilitator superfamily domain-containing protein [Chytriomyces sp. MP71]|nr:major facilitator superfamily domain-containing protein [Chytriomyces sp. MP71]KAI8610791.1 major facilitator superfamily domain-containing protein [Chytriomyces sp. MP71]
MIHLRKRLVFPRLSALDQTIVATALKSIFDDLGRQDLSPWLGSSYLMTAAPLGTLYGKFADIFGRKWVFIFAIVVFELGSAMCGAAKTMEFLIAGRAVAGVGGGGIFSLVLIIISDIVSLRDRGKFQGLIGAVFGLASVIAPLIGGTFSDNVTWRWCFYINLPLGAITLATVIAFLNFPPPEGTINEKLHRIDGLGAILLFISIICLVTPLQLGGSTWAWNSAQVISLFILSVVFGAIFVYVELKVAKEPIIPSAIFVNRSVPALLGISLCLGAGFLSGVYYVSLFFQAVFDVTATQAGLAIIPMVIGLVIMSISSGLLVSKYGTYRHFLFIGPVIMGLGIVLMSTLNGDSNSAMKILYLGVFGLGVGSMIQVRILGTCSASRATTTAVAQTCNTLGGAVGVSITGTIFNNVVVSATQNDADLLNVVGQLQAHNVSLGVRDVLPLLSVLSNSTALLPPGLPPAAQDAARGVIESARGQLVHGFNEAYRTAYLCTLPYPVLILCFALLVQNYKMKGGRAAPAE